MGLLDWLFGSTTKKKPSTAAGTPDMAIYRSDRFGFAMRRPRDWEVLSENQPADDWTIPIQWASPQKPDGRAGFTVNVKQSEILNKNPSVKITRIGPHGAIEDPSTPQEFLSTAKAGLSFPDLRHEAAQVIKVAGFDAAQLVYSYAGQSSRIREITTTVFGVGATFQFICEAPVRQFDEHKPVFDAMLNSFALGTEPAGVQTQQAHTAAADEHSMIGLFNQAVESYKRAQFKKAEDLFAKAYGASGATLADKMVAAYAGAITQRQLGKNVVLPRELANSSAETGCAYLAYTMAGQLIHDGHRAAISGNGTRLQVDSEVNGKRYRLTIGEMMGQFMNSGERIVGDKRVGLGEATSVPKPDKDDVYVADLLKRVSGGSAPPTPIPTGGFPQSI